MTGTDGTEPGFVQNVTAVNGFAYGAIGADIHVFTNGLPLYLLANWHSATPTDPDWLRELPSRMLNARRAVVPFTGRQDDLEDLRQWREAGPRLAVRWLHGPGGLGKTRLANQFAAESATAGWKIIAAFHGPDADQPEPGSQDLRHKGSAGLLMIVDYADRWLLSHLTWLFKNNLLLQTGVATRVLMVARTADTWPAIRGILDTHQAATSSHLLPTLTWESGERTGMFGAARDSFAALYQLSAATVIQAPGSLDDPEFGLSLAVHMAALVAVDAWLTGKRPPPDMAGLTVYLLDREQLHWARLYGDAAKTAGTDSRTYRTPPEVMNQTVFTAALTGTVTPAIGTVLLSSLQVPMPEQVLHDHAVCYPPTEAGHSTAMEPLYPDRLAEDFLALTMPGHPADYPAQPWAATTASMLLARYGKQRAPAPWTSRTITFLASAAHRWPHLTQGYLHPLLLSDPQLAVEAGNTALTTLADLPSVDPAVLEAIDAHLPSRRHVDLDTGIAALTQRLADHRLTTVDSPAQRARIHHDLGIRLSYAGLYQRALAATEDAVAAYQRLARANPAAFEPDLATSLDSLGGQLSDLGRREEALAATESAVKIRRRLAQANPAAFEPDLARSLSNLGIRLAQLGRQEEALAATEDAVAVHRQLAQVNPAGFEHLAISLTNLGVMLSGLGKREEALATAREAVDLYQRLAQANPTAFEPDLAASLDNLGGQLSGLGRREVALAATESAVKIRRRLAQANPAAFEPELARSLSNLSIRLSQLGKQEEALTAAQEAVDLYQRLAQATPTAFEPHFAASLNNLGVMLSGLGRREEALAATESAVKIRRRLAQANPAAFEPDLAMSLSNLGIRLARLGRREEALAATESAVKIRRRLAQANPAAFEPDLAASLSNLGAALSELRRWEESLTATEEAAAVYRRLAQANPTAFEPDLAASLSNLGVMLSELERREEALAATESAVKIRRRLAQANPAAFEPDLATSLHAFAWIRAVWHIELVEAFGAIRESVAVYRRLVMQIPGAFTSHLSGSLGTAVDILDSLGRQEDAISLRRQVEGGSLDEAAGLLQETAHP